MPTLTTTPSRPPSDASESATTRAHAASSVTSATTTVARLFSLAMRCAVSRAAPSSRSAHATAAPSRAHNTAIARPLPSGASASSQGCVPAPTTRILRPASRLRPGVAPVASGGVQTVAGSRSVISALDLHAERVQRHRYQRVLPDGEHEIDHLPRVIVLAEALPRGVADELVAVQIVDCAQQRRLRLGPARRIGVALQALDLCIAEPGFLADARVLMELV